MSNKIIDRAKEHVGRLLEQQLDRIERIKTGEKVTDYSQIQSIIIGIIGGDGIGPYIANEAQRVLEVLLANELSSGKVEFRIIEGLTIERRAEVNKPIPEDVLEEIKQCHVTLKGPTTTPRKGDPWPNIESANIALRKELDLYANIRPICVPKDGIDWTLPVLQENYLQHISRLRPKAGDYICLGEIHGKLETEDQIRKLPQNVEYHGLAKGKYIEKRPFKSLDTSGWISAAMSKKTEVWSGNSTFSLFFGDKGRGMKAQVASTLERFKEHLEIVGISSKSVLENDYYSLLKLPIAVLYIPMCKSLGIYDINFKQ